MIPEFVGRMPVVATLDPLDIKTLINILTEPKNALVKQFQKFFRIEGSELEFTPGALELIAERALKRDTGARALRAVVEEIMMDLMYRLPDQEQGGKYVITEEIVDGRQSLFDLKPERRKESA
jgi:ATP-dependent Clp protease ATP-binding subunit ClpX